MPRVVIDPAIRQEIRASMSGLSNARAKAEAQIWADTLSIDISRIYAVTKDVRPARKQRVDSGQCRADLKNHAGLSFATTQVAGFNIPPKLALEMARRNYRELGFEKPEDATPISLGRFRRLLLQAGLNQGQRRSNLIVHRRWEAKAPGQIFHCDVSAVKTRWLDPKTKRALYVHPGDVNANHPNRKNNRVPLWKFSMKDDHSRLLFTRFFAAEHETSPIIIDLFLEAFRVMGVPLAIYTDNASVFRSKLTQRVARILNKMFADHGGFKWEFHAPYNSNAGGKIESSHQFVEQFEKAFGLGRVLTLDDMQRYAINFCDLYNWTSHRTTKEKPEIRFRAGYGLMREAPPEILNDALKAREISVLINSDVTIAVENVKWQLPRSAQISATLSGVKDVANPFIDLAASSLKKQIDVVWPVEADWFVAIAAGNEYTLAKIRAVADDAYEHKSVPEPAALRNAKHFKSLAAEQTEAIRKGKKTIVIPGVDVPFEIAAEARPAIMPRREVNPSLAEWANSAPGAATAVGDQLIEYFAAADLLQGEEILSNPLTLPEKHWLETLFNGREQIAESELRAAVAARMNTPKLAEVKSA